MLIQQMTEATEQGTQKQNEAALGLADAYRDLANKYREIATLLDREADKQVERTTHVTNQILNSVLGGTIEHKANGRDPLALVDRLAEELRK